MYYPGGGRSVVCALPTISAAAADKALIIHGILVRSRFTGSSGRRQRPSRPRTGIAPASVGFHGSRHRRKECVHLQARRRSWSNAKWRRDAKATPEGANTLSREGLRWIWAPTADDEIPWHEHRRGVHPTLAAGNLRPFVARLSTNDSLATVR